MKEPKNNYFTEQLQNIIIKYNNSNNQEQRQYLYNNYIHEAFKTIAQSLISKYNIEEKIDNAYMIRQQCISEMVKKMGKYDKKRGKAFTYFTVIARNFILSYLNRYIKSNKKYTNFGQVASYIPELKNANAEDLGICIIDKDNNIYYAGDYKKKFTIQSVSKTIILAMALMDNDLAYVFSKVGMEPSGDPFNSIMKLETDDTKKPCNPMINAGAIVTTSLIKGTTLKEKEERMLAFFRKIAKNDNIKMSFFIKTPFNFYFFLFNLSRTL